MRLAAAVAIALAAVLANAAPALAGGWAVTILDPLPERVESGHSYVVGYWVLQHGSHPSVIPLGETGLKLVDEKGQVLTFQGVPLREPAHYAAAVAIPNDGAWQLYGLQGVFREYRVGTLNVPGGLTALPTPTPLEMPGHSDHVWGAVHPPQVVAGPHAEIPQPGMAGTHSITGSTSAAPASQVPAAPITVGAALVVLVCLGLVFGGLRRRRAARQAPR